MRLFINLIVILTSACLLFLGCDILPEKNDDCNQTKWDEEIEVLVRPMFFVYVTDVASGYSLSSASKLTFSGSIQRVMCSGDSGFKTSFTNAFSGNELSLYVYQAFTGDVTKFYFGNDEDHLNVIWRLKANFTDGSIYETDELIQNIYYDNINNNYTSLYKYFELYLNNVAWHAVSK